MTKPDRESALVIGAGITGMQASLDLADMGVKVHLVEKRPCIGGRMAQLDKTFPTNDCSICILAPKLSECAGHPNITLHTLAEVVGVDGVPGNFKIQVLQHPRYVDEELCMNCGECVEKCPTRVDDEFNMGLQKRKAIYLDYLQGVPAKVTIDDRYCLYLNKGVCRLCEKNCPKEAINFEQKEKTYSLDVGAVIVAVGYDPFDPTPLKRLGYGRLLNVVTAMEFERLICASGPVGGHLERPSDRATPKKIAFIQCVGSRDRNFNAYCSAFCCMYTTKEAMIAHEHDNELESTIFYIDMRAGGKNFREYLARGEKDYKITYIKGKVGEIKEDSEKNPVLFYEDVATGMVLSDRFDLVVLATSVVPREGILELAKNLGLELDEYKFIKTSPLDAVVTSRSGIFACGCCHEPMDIPSSVVEASGAAAKVAEVLRMGG
ncbi:MAG: NAD(P)-binding protein [Promethearchaeota archaeon]